MAADVLAMPDAATALENQYVKFSLDGDKAMVNDALIVVLTDVAASNGVIHVIDTVLLPPDKDIVETAACKRKLHHPGCRP